MGSRRLPTAMLFAAAVLWGLSIPVMKALGVEQSLLAPGLGSVPSSLASLAIRFGLAGLLVAALARLSPRAFTALELRQGFILGVVTAVSMFLQVDGLAYTTAATSGFLIALYCVFVPVFACALRLRSWSAPLAVSCLLVIAGMAALTGVSARSLALGRGEYESLGAACLFAVQILRIGALPPGSVHPSRVTVILCVTVSCMCLLALCAFPGGPRALPRVHASALALALTFALAFLGTALPFFLMNRFQPLVDAVPAGFIYCFEPITAVAGAMFLPELLTRDPRLYPDEAPTARLLIGGALIVAANLFLLFDPQTRAEAPKKSA